ncbi:MAG TPA: succinyl-diaminopimelate desuccinylase [Afifellaceae bacterium]|nr:succinyl-diaminopimelate desuccinylase [Afifellaceae bacterium]
MIPPPDPEELLRALVRAPSVTPDVGAALDMLEAALRPAGFEVHRPVFSAPDTPDVENLFAAIGSGEPHLTFAGHVDVVPPGPAEAWRYDPFGGEVEDGTLYGRGAVDMKGGVAAMAAAALGFVARRGPDFGGRLSLLITGDEEGPAVNGTAKLLEWAVARGERFDAALVGEPTSSRALGDQIKVGRRGSFSATLFVEGRQGHAAYPHLAENPVRGLVTLLAALLAKPLDEGSEAFEPSTLEIVSVDVGNPAWNVIPGRATARLNSRYNDLWTGQRLREELERRLAAAAEDRRLRPGADWPVRWRLVEEPSPSDVFLTRDDKLIAAVTDAVERVTGRRPQLSTGGGTSDARFIKDYCPVVELGLVGTTMHQVDERVPLAEVEELMRIYGAFLAIWFERTQ